MAEIYGFKWSSAYGENPNVGAAVTWAKGLAGLSGRQLADGLAACIASAEPWPPTLPQFRMMCLGIPPFDAVRADTGKQDGFTRLVWQYLDGHRYRLASADKADKLLLAAYNRAKEAVMRGAELPPAPEAHIAYEVARAAPATREQVARHMDDIARELGIGMVADPPPAAQEETTHDPEAVCHAA
ncbi:hypothetical protein N5J29_12625 [Stenotrophomonas sp. GD03680]|uniref:hypothetical protein n=1 Tax=Stenotrophomonas sp. GD03680 TaxID=2975365 RepID=UPI00244BE4B6|nr:hypothetical protein [Stenotrophomonas sp. GD03680]MDH2023600.1 hypothetical protein [Stenotrophomonas sp. GD03680]